MARVDDAQYENRRRGHDFDMITAQLGQDEIPGAGVQQYFGSKATGDVFNAMGLANPAVDALITQVEAATTQEELTTRVHALDRVLRALHFWVPQWFKGKHTVAYWDMYARGTIVGLTRGANRNHIVRATLESIALQTKDVLRAMEDDSGITLKALKVDGGAVANNFLMQFQSDILGVQVDRPKVTETTAMGAAFLAGLAVGFWKDKAEIAAKWNVDHTFQPNMSAEARDKKYHGWKKAVERSRQWEENDH